MLEIHLLAPAGRRSFAVVRLPLSSFHQTAGCRLPKWWNLILFSKVPFKTRKKKKKKNSTAPPRNLLLLIVFSGPLGQNKKRLILSCVCNLDLFPSQRNAEHTSTAALFTLVHRGTELQYCCDSRVLFTTQVVDIHACACFPTSNASSALTVTAVRWKKKGRGPKNQDRVFLDGTLESFFFFFSFKKKKKVQIASLKAQRSSGK